MLELISQRGLMNVRTLVLLVFNIREFYLSFKVVISHRENITFFTRSETDFLIILNLYLHNFDSDLIYVSPKNRFKTDLNLTFTKLNFEYTTLKVNILSTMGIFHKLEN